MTPSAHYVLHRVGSIGTEKECQSHPPADGI